MFYEHCLRKTRVLTASRIVGGRFEPITKENENFVRGETTFDIVEYQEKREMSYVFFFLWNRTNNLYVSNRNVNLVILYD